MSIEYFTCSTNQRIAYSLTRNETTKDLVILAHGMFCGMDFSLLVKLCTNLSLHFNVLRFDFFGSGQSDGEWKYGGYEREAFCLQEMVRFARESGFIVKAVVGHSKGGTALLYYGSTIDSENGPLLIPLAPRVKAILKDRRLTEQQFNQLENEGYTYFTDANGKKWKIDKESVEERKHLKTLEKCEIIKVPVCIIHGTRDGTCPFAESESAKAKIHSSVELVPVEGANHSFVGKEDIVADIIYNKIKSIN